MRVKKTSLYHLKSFAWSSHQAVAELLKVNNAQNILDVGCDMGFLGASLDYRPKGLVGIDKESLPELLNYSKIWQADVESNPLNFLGDTKFQVIVLADILEHLHNPAKVLDKLKLRLEKKGDLIISLPNMGFFLVRILDFFHFRPKSGKGLFDKTHIHDFTYDSAQEFLSKQGLKVVEIVSVPVPLPIFTKEFDKGGVFYWIYGFSHWLSVKFPSIFSYQTVFVCKMDIFITQNYEISID